MLLYMHWTLIVSLGVGLLAIEGFFFILWFNDYCSGV